MNAITTQILEQFKLIVGATNVFTDADSIEKYGKDETEQLHYAPQVIVKPRQASEIAQHY